VLDGSSFFSRDDRARKRKTQLRGKWRKRETVALGRRSPPSENGGGAPSSSLVGRLVRAHFKRGLFGFLGCGVLLSVCDKSSETGIGAKCF
jgi:hypothetical protein